MNKLILVDFDKTLIRVNSFPLYFFASVFFSFFSSVTHSKKLIFLAFSKIFRISYSHKYAKATLINASSPLTISFVCFLLNFFVDKNLLKFLKGKSNNYPVVLCSGADQKLLKVFVDKYVDFNIEVQGSYTQGEILWDNIGINKLRQYNKHYNCGILEMYSDHYSDFCFLDIVETFYVIRPDTQTRKIAEQHENFEKIVFL